MQDFQTMVGVAEKQALLMGCEWRRQKYGRKKAEKPPRVV
jgi:hypothetical protein